MIVVATHHKTGHHLLGDIFRTSSDLLKLEYYDVSLMSFIPETAQIVVYEQDSKKPPFSSYRCEINESTISKGIHVIRHPYEVIVSGYNWHKIIEADWVNRKNNGMSYKDHLLKNDGLIYEMKNRAKETIFSMYNWDYQDKRFLNLKMEQFWEDFDGTVEKMAKYLDLDEEVLASASRKFNIREKIPPYATNQTGKKWKWESVLCDEHIKLFNELFPSNTLRKLGYA
jgi:hypothetical protein